MKRILLITLILICLASAPLFITNEYVFNLIILISLYVILSHAWNILGGYTGQVSLGHSTFFGMGALVFRYVWSAGLSPYLALGAGAVASLLLAAVIGFPALKLKGHYFAIGTLALAMIALITVQNILPGVSFLPPQFLQGYSLIPVYYMALIVGMITTGLIYGLAHSKVGVALACVREDEEAAEAIGINTFKFKVISMSLSTLLAGLGGGVFSFYVASYYYYVPFDLGWAFDPVLISFIGGAGTLTGPILGSVVFVLLKELFAISLGQMNVLIFGIVFILTVLFFPKGIIGIPQLLRRRKPSVPLVKKI
ncbi:MAG: branched-chain amino acid ABC transporter permease [Thermodesulfobacteriota bacterium]